jgi:methylenetetrahydrofolate dehydrogenase (NADP+)/methenyltetrahydrofolate cyclohydrolase
MLLLDGKALAKQFKEQILSDAQVVFTKIGRKPGLAVILVGENPASKVYVASKTKAAIACGIDVFDQHLSKDATQDELETVIKNFNENPKVDGILLQLPLPKHLDELKALSMISPEKDADGLHPSTQGLLLRGAKTFVPCTPAGSMALLDSAVEKLGFNIAGKKALVVGRSILVGKPLALLLLERGATVTIAHSKTKNIQEECRSADILVAAIGQPEFVKGSWIKPGAVVIDVGINRLEDGRLVGDVEFETAKEFASAITPVPGGVGPMTITMLLKNTVLSASKRNK